jgi:hypothetical protein
VAHGHRENFTAESSDDVLSTCGPAWCRSDLWNYWRSFPRREPRCSASVLLPVRARAPVPSAEGPRTWARSGPASTGVLLPPGRRSARVKARRRSAARRHSGVGCTDAPLPGSRRRGSGTRAPERTTTRSSSLAGARSRHPTQVRTGFDVSATLHSSAWPGRDVPRVGAEGGARRAGRSQSPPARPNAGVGDPPRARESRRRRRAGRRCGCRSGSR